MAGTGEESRGTADLSNSEFRIDKPTDILDLAGLSCADLVPLS